MLNSSVARDFIRTIEYVYDIFNDKFDLYSISSDLFSKKLEFVKTLDEEVVKNLSKENKFHLYTILRSIATLIDSKVYVIDKDYSADEDLIDYVNNFKEQVSGLIIRYNEEENRVLLHYGLPVTYSRDWNNLTTISRGIVVDLDNYSIVVHPYNKFFNFSEQANTQLDTIPEGKYEVAEKLDGSEGILYPLKNENSVKVITKGGFNTDQGQFATKLLWEKYPEQAKKIIKERIYKDYTITFEILYERDNPNRIVVAYDEADLRIIGVRDLSTGEELSYSQVIVFAQYLGFPAANLYDITFEEILELREDRENFEGWVVRFEDGLYLKVKCKPYLDAHGAKFGSSIKYVFNLLRDEKWDDFISNIKVEHREVPEALYKRLTDFAVSYSKEFENIYSKLPQIESKKEFALYVTEHVEKEYRSYMFRMREEREINLFKETWSLFKDKFERWEEKV